jgi:hypothetical protein
MTWRYYLLLGFLGLSVSVAVAAFQPAPGYMDADYYAANGLQLASGRGFTEPFLWNYLDNPSGLPHPSHAYWMPLASLLAAAGAALFRTSSWSALRIGFMAVTACIPPVTAALSFSWSSRRDLALAAGLLAVFPAFYLPFLSTTDTFGPYLLLGGLFFLALNMRSAHFRALILGLLAGLMHLSRADGMLWLAMALLAVIFIKSETPKRQSSALLLSLLLCFVGYFVVMGPWLYRNVSVFGTPLAPGGSRSLWLRQYDQLFSYPALSLNFSSWWESGLAAILKARLWALGMNLANAFGVQSEVLLLPLIGTGLWVLRRDRRVRLAILGWLLTIGAMTVAFPFAGARGGFLHSGAALQPVWWAVALVGLDQLVDWTAHLRDWNRRRAGTLFGWALIIAAALVSVGVVYGRVIGRFNGAPVWGQEGAAYQRIGEYLSSQGAEAASVVIVANPPGFYLASGHPAIAVPDGDVGTIRELAGRYGAQYLVLEKDSTPAILEPLYLHPDGQTGLQYLGEVEEARIFVIHP